MTTAKEIKERRVTVQKLYMSGVSPETIAKQYEVSERQIYKDLEFLRTERAKTEQMKKGWELIAELSEKEQFRLQKLWSIISDKDSNKKEKMMAIHLLQNEDDLAIKKAQICGILPKESVQMPSLITEGNTVVNQQINIRQELYQLAQQEAQFKLEQLKKAKTDVYSEELKEEESNELESDPENMQ